MAYRYYEPMGKAAPEKSTFVPLLIGSVLGCLLLGFLIGFYLENWITGLLVGAVLAAVASLAISLIKRKRIRDLAAAEEYLDRVPVQVGVTSDGTAVYATDLAPGPGTSAHHNASTNTFAILALVFGVLGGALAIPFGHIARSQIRRTRQGGAGLALAGLILGYIWLAIIAAIFIIVMIIAASQR